MNLRRARTMFDDLSNAELIRALKSNSDEIARLAEALRKAESAQREGARRSSFAVWPSSPVPAQNSATIIGAAYQIG